MSQAHAPCPCGRSHADPDMAASHATESSGAAPPKHLVVLCNGIWGGEWHWTRLRKRLMAHPAAGGVLVHASEVNTAFATGDGERKMEGTPAHAALKSAWLKAMQLLWSC